MSFANLNHQPTPTVDEARLRQLDNLIADAERAEAEEAERKAQEARQRAEREQAGGSYTLDDLKRLRAELAAQLLERETHLRVARDLETLRTRIGSKAAEIDFAETKLAVQRADLQVLKNQEAELVARLGQ